MKRDFLRLGDLSPSEYQALWLRSAELKAERRARQPHRPTLAGRTVALVFEKASTRTRVSFEAGITQLGGHAITLSAGDSQLGRGEPIADTARVLSRYVDAIMLRTFSDDRLSTFARAATVPVINGLSDGGHPVQLLADLLTVQERLGALEDRSIAFVGDGSGNMVRSWIEAAGLFHFRLSVAAPEGFRPPEANRSVRLTADAASAVEGADVVVTDVWTSMGQEAETARRRAAFAGYCVDGVLLSRARPEAIVLHCLPAHRGEEISEDVIEGPHSAVLDEAENRLHTQKALLEQLLS